MLQDKLYWIYPSQLLEDEYTQCRSEGRLVEGFSNEITEALAMPEGEARETRCVALLDALATAPMSADFPFAEPMDYQDILRTLPPEAAKQSLRNRERLDDALRGGWYGRAIGCLLGIPVECWMRGRIEGFLRESGQYPLHDYIRSDVDAAVRERYGVRDDDPNTCYDRQCICWRNNVDRFPVDDDTNYTVAALKTVERFGRDFTTQDAAETWVYSFPAFIACTAERVAYRNLLCGVLPPHSATVRNPYREWIGAQIRGDFFGYICPGDPHTAARMAYRDASVSHVKNGAYGEMYIAALIALCHDHAAPMDTLVEQALLQIPPRSRLHRDLLLVLGWFRAGEDFSGMVDRVHRQYNEAVQFDWCHTNPNAMLVTAALLCYSQDFSAAVCRTVEAGFDTDCNGATVGSALGVYLGFGGIDPKWYSGLAPSLTTSITGYFQLELEELVQRSHRLIRL